MSERTWNRPADREPISSASPSARRWRESGLAVGQALAVTTLGVLPSFLVGALAVDIMSDLEVGPGAIGLATASLFAVSGIWSPLSGRIVQRAGTRLGFTVAALLSAASLALICLASSLPGLLTAMVVGGLGNSLAPAAANLAIARAIGPIHLGVALGIKQSCVPASTLVGGLAVPIVAGTVGWRVAPASMSVVAVLVAIVVSLRPAVSQRSADLDPAHGPGLSRRVMVLLPIAAGVASAGSTSIGVFLVDAAGDGGLSVSTSGILFAACSLLGLCGRILVGYIVDRWQSCDAYVLIAGLMATEVVGLSLLSLGQPASLILGAVLAYAIGWLWPGLLHYVVVRGNRAVAARSTGTMQAGYSLGAAIGPFAFGQVSERFSYRGGWLMAAALMSVSFGFVIAARQAVSRDAAQAATRPCP